GRGAGHGVGRGPRQGRDPGDGSGADIVPTPESPYAEGGPRLGIRITERIEVVSSSMGSHGRRYTSMMFTPGYSGASSTTILASRNGLRAFSSGLAFTFGLT